MIGISFLSSWPEVGFLVKDLVSAIVSFSIYAKRFIINICVIVCMRDSKHLTTTIRSLTILDLLKERNGATVTQIAEEMDLPPSTVHGHLKTLKQQEYVVQENKTYDLGTKFLSLGNYVMERKNAYTIADDYTKKIVEETPCRSIFAIEEHGHGVYISRNAGKHSEWRHESLGNRFNLHSTAAGKVILAHFPHKRVQTIIDRRGLQKMTDNTITDQDSLYTELEEIADRGFAFNREEQIEGIRAVSAPVFSEGGDIIGALSANGPTNQMVGEWYETELPEVLLGIANEFELEISLGSNQSMQ